MPGEPVYVAIARSLRWEIRSGRLQPGERMPSYLELAKQYNVSDTVIRYALAELKRQGLVQGERRKGVFVVDAPPDETVRPGGYPADMTQPGDLEERVRHLEEDVRVLREVAHVAWGERGGPSHGVSVVHGETQAIRAELSEFRGEMGAFRAEVGARFEALEALIREALGRRQE